MRPGVQTMSYEEFREWERRTDARAARALRLCKWLGAFMLACWAASLVWVSERNRTRVDCIYNAESVEAWQTCSKVTRLELLVRRLNSALLDF